MVHVTPPSAPTDRQNGAFAAPASPLRLSCLLLGSPVDNERRLGPAFHHSGGVDLDALLDRHGGVISWRALRRVMSARRIRAARIEGRLVRVARGRYVGRSTHEARVAAARLCGAVSHTSAAVLWGWSVLRPPQQPHVTIPRKRHVDAARRAGVTVTWRDLGPADVEGVLTSRPATAAHCLADLPFDEAVAVADSALRDGLGRREIEHAINRLPARRRRRAFVALDAATALAANAFESGLRVIAHTVPGLSVRPQVLIGGDGFWARVDLADEENQIVLEADSFQFHGTRGALKRDAERYNELSVRGWLVLRFAWEHVMFEPDWIAAVLAAAVDTQRSRRRGARSRRTGAKGRTARRSA